MTLVNVPEEHPGLSPFVSYLLPQLPDVLVSFSHSLLFYQTQEVALLSICVLK